MENIVVIGANHAGIATINTILDNYDGYSVTVFDKSSNISFLGCGMALWIGGQIKGSDGLFYSSKETLEKKGATIYLQTEVTWIDFDNKTIYALGQNGKKYEKKYDKLVIATGSMPIVPTLKGSELENIQKVKVFQDAEDVIKKLKNYAIKNVSVIGAGYIGVELVEAFKRYGKNVTLIDIEKTCLNTYYDEPFTEMMKKRLKDNGINLKFNNKVCGFDGKDGKVSAIITDKETIPTDLAIWAVGFRPNSFLGKDGFFDDIDIFLNGAYLVNERQQTNIKDVYAVGDCATIKDNAIKGTNYIALATNAVRSGIIAGHNICGNHLETIGVQGSNAISIFGLNMVSTGITYQKAIKRGMSVTCADYADFQRPEFMKENEKVSIRIVFDKKTRVIVGAQLASDYDMSMIIHMFSLAIQEGFTIDKLKLLDIFFLPHFNKPYNYITMAALTAPDTK